MDSLQVGCDWLQVIKSRRWKHTKCYLRLEFMPLSVYALLLHDAAAFHYFYTQVSESLSTAAARLSPNSITPTSEKVGNLSLESRRHGSCYGEVIGMFRRFQTIATCRDGLKNSRDKSTTSPFASEKRGNRRRPRQDTGSRRRRGHINGNVTGLARTCCWRHGEVGIVEFGF